MVEAKGMKTLARSMSLGRLSVGFLLGFLLVLFTYFTVSQLFASLATYSAFSQPSPTFPAQTAPSTEAKKGSPQLASGDSVIGTEDGLEEALGAHEPGSRTDFSKEEEDDVVRVQEETSTVPSSKEAEKKRSSGDEIKAEDQKDNPFTTDFWEFGGRSEGANQALRSKPICQVDSPSSDVCDIVGDVRTHGVSSTVLIVPPSPMGNGEAHEWRIKPYSRKNFNGIKEVNVKQLNGPQEAPPCSVRKNIPALVFTTGGLIGNYWHDFSDLLVPLFIASRQFGGEVEFLITNIQPWWIGKYHQIIKKLSRYEIIDFDRDNQIRCYPRVLVGLTMHKEFSIDPSRAPKGYSMPDFTKFLRNTFLLPRDSPVSLRQDPGVKPRLMIIDRRHYRKFTNVPEIVSLAQRLGYEVVVTDPKFGMELAESARTVNSFDVLMGMHGAGLTNAVFLPTKAVLIQVVPYGNLEHMAKTDFGDPMVDMKLNYLEYSISAEESTLMDMFGKDHPIIKDPESIHRSGWDKVAEFYLGKQDVRINVGRFEPVLLKAIELLS